MSPKPETTPRAARPSAAAGAADGGPPPHSEDDFKAPPGVDPYEYFRGFMRLHFPQFRLEEGLAEVKVTAQSIREALVGEGGLAQAAAEAQAQEAAFRSHVVEQLAAIREAQQKPEPSADPREAPDAEEERRAEALDALKRELVDEIRSSFEGLRAGGETLTRQAASDGCARMIDKLSNEQAELLNRLTDLATVVAKCLRDMETFIKKHYDGDARELPSQLYEGIVGEFANVGIVRIKPAPDEPFRPQEHDGDGVSVTRVRDTRLSGYKWLNGERKQQVLLKAKVY